ncbi:MAG: MurR/RpiR family transcriptional regulator [Bifidobacterium aquikefiri]|uniref:RpiR family transcriptional regulator n=1 Tax=Bifidobacterium aquikefiri TaxID=1653207 RepID=A0A261G2X4_9BIFI|nr:MurR/RpiR family transcriptional regulator [Bifidobacterium aquikefiri]OZG65738.1 RpiR family transcriptional regulator [Bifidobacterium aquikefiri]
MTQKVEELALTPSQPMQLSSLDDLFACLVKAAESSPTARKVATCIEKNYSEIVFMTAAEVASRAGVSQGSVSRFCMLLGFAGYNNFQRNLQHIHGIGLTAPERLERISQQNENNPASATQPRDSGHQQNAASSVKAIRHRSLLQEDINAINQLQPIFAQKQYNKLVESLAAYPHIILTSARISATLLPYFAYTLNKIRTGIQMTLPGAQEWELMDLNNPKDTLVVTTVFPRYSETLMRKLEQLHQRGFTIIALTDSRLSPIVKLSDESIILPVNMTSAFDDYAALAAFFSIVLEDCAAKITNLSQRIELINELEAENKTYRNR